MNRVVVMALMTLISSANGGIEVADAEDGPGPAAPVDPASYIDFWSPSILVPVGAIVIFIFGACYVCIRRCLENRKRFHSKSNPDKYRVFSPDEKGRGGSGDGMSIKNKNEKLTISRNDGPSTSISHL